MRLLISLLLTSLVLCAHPVSADSLEQQRKLYLSAKKSLRDGNLTAYLKTTEQLKDYPLYPYLVYDYMRPRLSSLKDKDILSFLHEYPDTLLADDLRYAWLKLLAQRNRWQEFLQNYTPQSDVSLQCYQLQARIKAKQTDKLLEDTIPLWLSGKSQPDVCNPAFDLLGKSPLMTNDLIWERIRLSIKENELGLAGFLGRKLDKKDQPWVTRWIATWQNPAKATSKPGYEDVAIAREILSAGIKKLAVSDVKTAIARWEALKPAYTFSPDQVSEVERTLGIRAMIKKHPHARQYLDAIANSKVDDELFHWRLRNALETRDWDTLARWTEGTPNKDGTPLAKDDPLMLRWMYWRARALEQTGKSAEARQIYEAVSGERDYYGFLAADRVSMPYNMEYQPLTDDPETWQAIRELPGLKRARELFMTNAGYPSRREWNYTLKNMSVYHKEIAAALASEWGWHDRAILTLAQEKRYDNLVVRFPIAFEDKMLKYAKLRELDPGWLFALTRAESAFIVDVKSPTGALGLMQVMPRTGAETAKHIGMKNFNAEYLKDAEKNITIGTAYLKQMHDRFDNKVLATAAYNAGPNAVSRWVANSDCSEPDIFVEQIPYNETRKYVMNIMFYSAVYDWRLNNTITRVSDRMNPIMKKGQAAVADLSCTVGKISSRS